MLVYYIIVWKPNFCLILVKKVLYSLGFFVYYTYATGLLTLNDHSLWFIVFFRHTILEKGLITD